MDLAALFADPVRFARTVLQANLWETQERILAALAKPNARVAVKSCHASGKSHVAAAAALWFPIAYPDGITLTTAPTWVQVSKTLWGEIHQHISKSRIVLPKASTTELRLGPKNYALGLSTNEGVRFQGLRGNKTLIVLDEAPGIKPEIWEAIESIRAGGDVRVLAIGNPTIPGGPFYDAFTRNREHWTTMTISAFDTPNLRGLTLDDVLAMDEAALDVAERPYLTLRRFVANAYRESGPESAFYQARVLGDFPAQADDALISLAWVDAAMHREPEPLPERWLHGHVTAGLDVAGPGKNETVLILRCGRTILLEKAWAQAEFEGPLLETLRPWRERLRSVNVDAAGIGYKVAQYLQNEHGLPVRFINVGEATSDTERFKNLKAELYWGLRLRFQEGDVAGAMSDTLVQQLCSLKYKLNERGQVEIEKKEQALKRGVVSPDRAEALMLAFAGDGAVDVVGTERPARPPVRMPRMEVGV